MPEIWNRGHPPLHPLGGLSSRHWPRIQRLFCSQLGHWEDVLESFSNPSTVSRMIPHLTLKDDPYLGPSQCWWDSNGFSGKLLPVISLKSQGETKLEINGKPYQIFFDIWNSLSKLHLLWSLKMGCWENWQKPEEGEDQCQLPWISVAPGWGRKAQCSCEFGFGVPIGDQSFLP